MYIPEKDLDENAENDIDNHEEFHWGYNNFWLATFNVKFYSLLICMILLELLGVFDKTDKSFQIENSFLGTIYLLKFRILPPFTGFIFTKIIPFWNKKMHFFASFIPYFSDP